MISEPILFGKAHDQNVFLYCIENEKLKAAICDFGATLVRFEGYGTNIVCGYDSVDRYINNDSYMGATVLPCANRTRNASFVIDGTKYELPVNDGKNNLHSSLPEGSAQQIWKVKERTEDSITFSLRYKDGEIGFPGNREYLVTYALRDDYLEISYSTYSDKDTVFNPTNHSYFNLNGHGTVLDHELMIKAHYFTPNDSTSIPVGIKSEVAGTPFDFISYKKVGKDIEKDDQQIVFGNGYDHNFLIDDFDGSLRLAARLYNPENSLLLETYTTCPGIQIYTANYLANDKYSPREAICLETQYTPDSMNMEGFVKPIVKKDTWVTLITRYRLTKTS